MVVEKTLQNISVYLLIVGVITLFVGIVIGVGMVGVIYTGPVVDTGEHDVTYSLAVINGGDDVAYENLTRQEQELVDEVMENGSVTVSNSSVLPENSRHNIVGVDEATGDADVVPMMIIPELYSWLLRVSVLLFIVGVVDIVGAVFLISSKELYDEDGFFYL